MSFMPSGKRNIVGMSEYRIARSNVHNTARMERRGEIGGEGDDEWVWEKMGKVVVGEAMRRVLGGRGRRISQALWDMHGKDCCEFILFRFEWECMGMEVMVTFMHDNFSMVLLQLFA